MTPQTAPSLEERVAHLEALVHRQAEELAVLREEVRSAPRTPFRVVDENGQTVLEVARGEGGVRLRLLDEGRFLVSLASVRSGGSVALHGSHGVEVVGIAASPNGGTVGVSTADGKLSAWMNVTASGGNVITRNSEGSVTGKLP